MMAWFQSREPRERVLILVMVALLALTVVWVALNRESGPSGQAQLEAAQADRELWLRAAPKLGGGGAISDREAFTRGALIEVARKRGVDISRMQPQSNGGLTVWIEDVQTASLYGLINDLTAAYSVDVETMLVNAGPNEALNAQFTLTPI